MNFFFYGDFEGFCLLFFMVFTCFLPAFFVVFVAMVAMVADDESTCDVFVSP